MLKISWRRGDTLHAFPDRIGPKQLRCTIFPANATAAFWRWYQRAAAAAVKGMLLSHHLPAVELERCNNGQIPSMPANPPFIDEHHQRGNGRRRGGEHAVSCTTLISARFAASTSGWRKPWCQPSGRGVSAPGLPTGKTRPVIRFARSSAIAGDDRQNVARCGALLNWFQR